MFLKRGGGDLFTDVFTTSNTCNSSIVFDEDASNSTCKPQGLFSRPSWTDYLIAVTGAFVIIVTVTGNFLVIASYKRDRRVRSMPGNRLILGLSVADLLNGLVSQPLYLQNILLRRWIIGDTLCTMYLIFDYCTITVSVIMIANISLDRYWMVTKKLKYRSFMTKGRSAFMIVTTWVGTSTVVTALTFTWSQKIGDTYLYDEILCVLPMLYEPVGSVVMITLQIAIPTTAIVFLNVSVFVHIWRRNKRFGNKVPKPKETQYPNTRDRGIIHAATSNANIFPNGHGEGEQSVHLPSDIELNQTKASDFPDAIDSTHCPALSKVLLIKGRVIENSKENDAHAGILMAKTTPAPYIVADVRKNQHIRHCVDAKGSQCGKSLTKSFSCLPSGVRHPSGRFRIHETRELARIRRAAFTLSTLVLVFLLCWIPFAVTRVYNSFCGKCLPFLTRRLTGVPIYLNSTINPLLYAATNPRFKRNFLDLLNIKKLFSCR